MTVIVEKARGFRSVARAVTAEALSSAALAAAPDIPSSEPMVEAPKVRLYTTGHYYRRRQPLLVEGMESRRLVAIEAQELSEGLPPATPADMRKRTRFELLRCAEQSVNGSLTRAMARFRKNHLPEVWRLEEKIRNNLAAAQERTA